MHEMAGKKRSMKLGGGGRFKAIEEKAAKSGAKNPKAVAATVGMKKYGKKKMASMAAKGRKRAAKKPMKKKASKRLEGVKF